MSRASRSQGLSLFVAILACLTLSGAVPLTEGENGERSYPANPKASEQATRSQDPAAFPGNEAEAAESHQVRAAASGPPRAGPPYDEETLADADAKTLAAILLQALKIDEDDEPAGGEEAQPRRRGEGAAPSSDRRPAHRAEPSEEVKGQTRAGKTERSPSVQEGEDSEWRGVEDGGDTLTPQSLDRLEAMLEGMEKHSKRGRPAAAQRPPAGENDVLRDLEGLEELMGRKEKYAEEDGARGWVKYRGEDGEAREGARKKNGQQKAADRASDLLLQYLLRGEASEEEEEDEEEEGDKVRGGQRMGGRSSEESASEEKRAEEEEDEEEEEEDIDPQTIDRLIEISSKLHLPADDVIDIINDVEKKRKDPAENRRSRDRFKAPASRPANRLPLRRPEKARHRGDGDLSLQELLGASDALDYEGAPRFAAPRRYRPRPDAYPNYIRPRVYQQRRRPYYYQPPLAPAYYRDYEDETRDTEEELENYIEKVLLKHPEVFQ